MISKNDFIPKQRKVRYGERDAQYTGRSARYKARKNVRILNHD